MSDHITIVGNIAGDPRHTHTASGIPITTFRVASSPRRFDRTTEKWVDGETSWYSVSTFRALALNAAASLHRGERVIVSGRLRIRTWEKGERSGMSAEIDAEAIGHDLLWGTSRFDRGGVREATPVSASANEIDGSGETDAAGWYAPGTTGDTPEGSRAGESSVGEASVMGHDREQEPVPF